MRGSGYAVVDLETAGLFAGGNDRVIEVAVVQTTTPGVVEHEWSSLVNPDRDLGPTDIHGITGALVADAPIFAEVANALLKLLNGRVLVGHNLRFDAGFLAAEFARLGIDLTCGGHCTLSMAGYFDLPHGRTLADCCEALNISRSRAHSALSDARATAQLFRKCLNHVRDSGMSLLGPAPFYVAIADDMDFPEGRTLERDEAEVAAAPQPYLSSLASQLPRNTGRFLPDPEAVLCYAELLDRVLEDRLITEGEVNQLVDVARQWGLTLEHIADVHRTYLTGLAAVALSDNVLTEAESKDLRLIAALLSIREELDTIVAAVTPAVTSKLTPTAKSLPITKNEFAGLSVYFTGHSTCTINEEPLTREHWELLAARAGLVIAPRVTKKLDILVVADPNSLSGKAKKPATMGRALSPTEPSGGSSASTSTNRLGGLLAGDLRERLVARDHCVESPSA